MVLADLSCSLWLTRSGVSPVLTRTPFVCMFFHAHDEKMESWKLPESVRISEDRRRRHYHTAPSFEANFISQVMSYNSLAQNMHHLEVSDVCASITRCYQFLICILGIIP